MADQHSTGDVWTTEQGSEAAVSVVDGTLSYTVTLMMPNACFAAKPQFEEVVAEGMVTRTHQIIQPFDVCAQSITPVTIAADVATADLGGGVLVLHILGADQQLLDEMTLDRSGKVLQSVD